MKISWDKTRRRNSAYKKSSKPPTALSAPMGLSRPKGAFLLRPTLPLFCLTAQKHMPTTPAASTSPPRSNVHREKGQPKNKPHRCAASASPIMMISNVMSQSLNLYLSTSCPQILRQAEPAEALSRRTGPEGRTTAF